MRKFVKLGICGLMAAMVATGCSKKDTTGTTDPAAATTQEAETQEAGTSEGAAEDSVTLGEYKGVAYTPASVEITDEQVDNEVQKLADSNLVEVDRPAAEGDTVNIDYVGKKDGVAFDGGTASGYDLKLGSNAFIDGFEDGLIGAVKGQKLDLDLTFPEGYPSEDLAGQAVVFEVTVNAVKTPSELNDDLVMANTDYKTLEEYREATRNDLEKQAADNAEYQKQSSVFQTIMNNSQVVASEESIQAAYDEAMTYYETMATNSGMELETLVGYYGMDLDTFKAQVRTQAEENAKQQLVINAIADKEGIKVTDEELESMAEEYGFDYRAAFSGCSTDTEPSAKTIAYLIDKVRTEEIPVVYYLELSSHRVSEIIGEETGAKPELLHSCHNVTRAEFDSGVTYVDLMKGNIETLRDGLD